MFKKGQQVAVLDDDMIGHVVKVNGTTITIETADGFELDFDSHELVVLKEALPINHIPISDIIKEKETPKKRKQPTRKAKEKYQPTMEVDLHIHQLTNSTRGMNNHDMLTLQLDTARRQLDFAISKRIQKVVFIHGVGQGVLKTELEYLFGRYNNVKFYEANYQKYGLGATEVYIYQNVSPN